MRLAYGILVLLLIAQAVGTAQLSAPHKKNKEATRAPLSNKHIGATDNADSFGSSAPKKKRGNEQDHFTKPQQIGKKEGSSGNRKNPTDDHFATSKAAKDRNEMPDHWASTSRGHERLEMSDHFAVQNQSDKKIDSPNHFSSQNKELKRRESDLEANARKKINLRKNPIGEPFRIVNRKTSDEKQKKANEKSDPHFVLDRRRLNQPQLPRGENGLFDGNVLPKMTRL